MTEPRRLVLLRHAKSSWDVPELADHDRPLNRRGREAATAMGAYLREHEIVPELVLCSSAVRAVETCQRLELDAPIEVVVENELYGATADELVVRLRRVAGTTKCVLLIGHNPGIQDLAGALTDDDGRLASFPTAALADLRVDGAWAALDHGQATLTRVAKPRDLG